MFLLPFLLLQLPRDDDCSGRAGDLFQLLWLQPTFRHLQLFLDLLDAHPVVVECMNEARTDLAVVDLLVEPRLGAMIVAEEAVLERERVSHFELFPHHNTSCAKLARVNDEAAGWKTDEF